MGGIQCPHCSTELFHINEGCPNCLVGTRYAERPPTNPCPTCARYAAKLKDREGLADVIDNTWEYHANNDVKEDVCKYIAEAVIRWMEG